MEQTGNDNKAAGAPSALNVELESLRADNARLWKMIKTAQDASNDAGLVGMVGSPAWVGQIKKALSNVELTGSAQPKTLPKE